VRVSLSENAVREDRSLEFAELEAIAAEARRPVPVRLYGQWVGALIVAVLFAMLVRTLIANPGFQWHVVRHYFFTTLVLHGLWLTIELTVVSMVIAIALGIVLAVMRVSPNPILSGASSLYIWFFRGTPLLVQIIFWFNLASLAPRLSLGVPFGPRFVTVETNTVITTMVAAIVSLGLNEGAYMAEIVRAGILSVDEGQIDAAQALGMSRLRTMRRIILPQAIRVIIPPTGNELIGQLKNTSLVSVIALMELLTTVEIVYQATFETIPLLLVAAIWYLVVTTVLSIGQSYIERHYSRGSSRAQPPTFFQQLRKNFVTFHVGPPPKTSRMTETAP
jgi:polar amino acid transport system permease protein